MTNTRGIADTSRPSGEPSPDCQWPGFADQDWLDSLAADDHDERRRLVRELVMRALV